MRATIELNDGSRTFAIIPEQGYRNRDPGNMRKAANPGALVDLLHARDIGYRTAADLIGIAPEKFHAYTRPVGHPRHRPCTEVVLRGLLLVLDYPEMAARMKELARSRGWEYLDVVRAQLTVERRKKLTAA